MLPPLAVKVADAPKPVVADVVEPVGATISDNESNDLMPLDTLLAKAINEIDKKIYLRLLGKENSSFLLRLFKGFEWIGSCHYGGLCRTVFSPP